MPVALGFFGLGTGYLIFGPQELLRFPARDRSDDRSMGVWGILLPGLCQAVTGIILFIGLAWFQVFQGDPALYMAAVAFTGARIGVRALGLFHVATGLWLMYLSTAVLLDLAAGFDLPK